MPELHVENLSKAYGARKVLDKLTLSASGGEVLTVVGANGSGKSTLLKIIAGLLRATAGKIRLTSGGRTTEDATERRRMIGYAGPDLAFYPELSAAENLHFFGTVACWDVSRSVIFETLKRVGLEKREDDFVGAYSSGMKQRLRLAFALLSQADVLLLDEPSLALDVEGVEVVRQIIVEQRSCGRLVVLATNDPVEISWGDRSIAAARPRQTV